VARAETILITGASAGIGLGLAEALLARGDRVFAVQRRSSPLAGRVGFAEACQDLSDFSALPARLEQLLAGVVELDRIVLNAAVAAELRDLVDTPLEELRRLMDINTWSNKVLLDAVFRSGVAVKQVIGISSGAAVRGSRGWNGYSLSKAAFAMLIQLYAAERPETHFCSLAPGIVQTRMQDDLLALTPAQRQQFPVVERLLAARGTADMPLPDVAAPRLLDAFERALREPSGAFLDLRQLNASRGSS